eukprot:TRINITY_DN75526_c0_g1_i1.p1 TRINITY_DN75526_c0_g1~~TRINITY_DN75526_c0_g1_i1.p1  ORF type:complete len:282 (-),score=31.87 TRINITY_DN75526_c0_g1_i1:62-907(-)
MMCQFAWFVGIILVMKTHCNGLPDLCPEPHKWEQFNFSVPIRSCAVCPEIGSLKSIPFMDGFRKTKVTFRNDFGGKVDIYYVGKHGNAKFMRVLAPNSRCSFQAGEGHVFRVQSSDTNQILLEHRVGRRPLLEPGMITMDDGDDAFEDLPVIRENTRSPEAYTNTGFFNPGNMGIHLFFRDKRGDEEKVSNMAPGDTHFESTYHGHEWVAKFPNDTVVVEFSIGDVPIVDCDGFRSSKINGMNLVSEKLLEDQGSVSSNASESHCHVNRFVGQRFGMSSSA